jgi:arylsulfatase A-like enzyme
LTSDHGEAFGEHNDWFHGHSLYREVSQVPFLIKFPKAQFAGRHCQEFVSICDALPTVLDYLKMKVPSGIDGISLLPMLQGSGKQRRTIFSSIAVSLFNEYLPPRFAMFFDHYKMIYNFPLPSKAQKFYQKFGQPLDRPKIELFDILIDPYEQNDISTQQQKLLDFLRLEIFQVLKEIRRSHNTVKGSDAMSEEEQRIFRSLGYF